MESSFRKIEGKTSSMTHGDKSVYVAFMLLCFTDDWMGLPYGGLGRECYVKSILSHKPDKPDKFFYAHRENSNENVSFVRGNNHVVL